MPRRYLLFLPRLASSASKVQSLLVVVGAVCARVASRACPVLLLFKVRLVGASLVSELHGGYFGVTALLRTLCVQLGKFLFRTGGYKARPTYPILVARPVAIIESAIHHVGLGSHL